MAKRKSKGNTGFRNGKLFCFNCGSFHQINYPQPVSMASAMMLQFAKDHANCKPVWKVPEPDMTQTKEQRMDWWLKDGERGLSSETMYSFLAEDRSWCLPAERYIHPSDPDDFRRCYLLLKAVPEWKAELHKVKNISPVWAALVTNWDELTKLLEEQMAMKEGEWKDNGMYDFMQKLGC